MPAGGCVSRRMWPLVPVVLLLEGMELGRLKSRGADGSAKISPQKHVGVVGCGPWCLTCHRWRAWRWVGYWLHSVCQAQTSLLLEKAWRGVGGCGTLCGRAWRWVGRCLEEHVGLAAHWGVVPCA